MDWTWRDKLKLAVATATVVGAFCFAAVTSWYQDHTNSSEPARPPTHATFSIETPAAASPPRSVAAAEAQLLIPVVGVRRDQLVDTFTQARASGARSHDAIDILAPRGTPVVAAAAGAVEKLFLSKDGGNTVYVRSPDGLRLYYYAHLDSYAPGLGEGMTLRQGSAIGAVGSSGNANPAAPHLHFAVWATSPDKKWWEEAAALNPYPLLQADRRPADHESSRP